MGKTEEITDLQAILQRKLFKAFKYVDRDKSGDLDRDEFKEVMKVANVNLSHESLMRLFDHVDFGGNGLIDFTELKCFIDNPFSLRDVIRVVMDENLNHPLRFVEYHILKVEKRPLAIKLRPGPNNIAAYFESGTDPNNSKLMDAGSKLTYINTARVDEVCYFDIVKALDKTPMPCELTFQNQENLVLKSCDSSGNLLPLERPSVREELLVKRPYTTKKHKDVIKQINDDLLLPPHCKHCPHQSDWYFKVHLFMEDENFSSLSTLLAYLIMLLIAVSTVTYIMQTVPGLEEWEGWKLLEAVVSIVFSVEFVVRLACCRSVGKYMKDLMNIVDFCAVVPYWLEVFTGGALQAQVLRVVRAVRLVRLVRLSKNSRIGEIMDIYVTTMNDSVGMLMTLLGMSILVLIVFASFATVCENGDPKLFSSCDLALNLTCDYVNDSNLLWNSSLIPSMDGCGVACEAVEFGGCCEFDQFTGYCQLYDNIYIANTSNSSLSASLCDVSEIHVRTDETTRSPFLTVFESFWWASVSMTIVGYGEINPITMSGRLVAVLAVFGGLFFWSLPVIVVGHHFVHAYIKAKEKKLASNFDTVLKKRKKVGVKQLLELANKAIDMELFMFEDELVCLSSLNALNTKAKLEDILGYPSGWAYLPYALDDDPAVTKISQFKLFILYAVFGRTYQRRKRVIRKKQTIEKQRKRAKSRPSRRRSTGHFRRLPRHQFLKQHSYVRQKPVKSQPNPVRTVALRGGTGTRVAF